MRWGTSRMPSLSGYHDEDAMLLSHVGDLCARQSAHHRTPTPDLQIAVHHVLCKSCKRVAFAFSLHDSPTQ